MWRKNKTKDFVTIKDGHFYWKGKRLKPHGINYMPSSGIGLENWNRFERWLGAPSYDPEIINRDLKRLKEIGFNSLSIFIYAETSPDRNLLDFLNDVLILF